MRPIFAMFAVLALGCSDATDSRVPALEARLSALEAAVGAIERPVDPTGAIVTLAERVAALEVAVKAVVVPRVPHLIVRETGQDLGPFVAWDMAWSPELQYYYSIQPGVGPLYQTEDCTGEAVLPGWFGGRVVTTRGSIFIVGSQGTEATIASTVGRDRKCAVYDAPLRMRVFPTTDTGKPGAAFDRESLDVVHL